MNIGLFTDTFFPHINGVATSTMMLSKELQRLGHKVFIFTTTDPNAKKISPYVFRLPSVQFFFYKTHRVVLMYPPRLLLKLKKLKLDIVHTHTEFPVGIFGKVASIYLKIPLVHTYHTMWEEYVRYIFNGHLITPKMAKKLSRILCNRTSAVVAPVKKAKDSLLEYGVTKPIHVIPTGIDFWPFSREKYTPDDISDTKKEIGLNLTDPVICHVGRIGFEKSIDKIVEAMPGLLAKLPDAKLVIVGDGPKRIELQELSAELGIKNSVIFTGFRPWSEIGKYYQLADVCAFASTTETQGLTYVEAMAAKVLVVAKNDPSIEELIINGVTGYTYEKDEELPELLFKVLTDRGNNIDIINAAYESIQYLSSAQYARNMEALYKEVIHEYQTHKQDKKRPRSGSSQEPEL